MSNYVFATKSIYVEAANCVGNASNAMFSSEVLHPGVKCKLLQADRIACI